MENEFTPHWVLKISKKWTKISIYGTLLVLIVYIFITPIICDYTDRSRIAELVILMNSAKLGVTEAIKANSGKTPIDPSKIQHDIKIGNYRDMRSDDENQIFIEHFEITPEGRITLVTSGLPAYIEFTPRLNEKNSIEWHCYGRPEKIMPVMCRTDKLITNQSASRLKTPDALPHAGS